MIEKIRTLQVPLGNKDILHKTILEGIESPSAGDKATLIKIEMLRQIVLNPHLVYCNTLDFETLKMEYIGGRWVLETRAVERFKE
jgi:hypothetical protein